MFWIVFIITVLFFSFYKAPLFIWLLFLFISLVFLQISISAWILLSVLCIVFFVPSIRCFLITTFFWKRLRKKGEISKTSVTEKQTEGTDDLRVEAEFFSGKPCLDRLLKCPPAKLSAKEQSFIEEESQTLCSMIDEWKVHKTRHLSEEVLQFIRKNKFLGLGIPQSYEGLGFSHLAHSRVLEKIFSKSQSAGIFVMVPNSLGPAHLLLRYGTEKQKQYYLPRLAQGVDIPCFGLTEPQAGSDASSISASGVLFKDKESSELKVRLNWNKRWVTLAPIADLLGIVFKLKDPEHLLGSKEDLGFTCAVISAQTPGVEIGLRHDPMGISFPNGPVQGRDVVIKAEEGIIGGLARAGEGWAMFMECLAAGRGISLPSFALSQAKVFARTTVQYTVLRKQFGRPLYHFGGIQEPLSYIVGWTYLSQAILSYSLSMMQQKTASSVCSAMSKYQMTEWARQIVTKGMDIMGGVGLSLGPKNKTALSYMAMPIAITVEGSNILTRSFIIFGLGIMHAHPYLQKYQQAIEEQSLKKFDLYFFQHLAHIIQNVIRMLCLSMTRGIFSSHKGFERRAWQKLNWASCVFCVLSEIALISFRGRLKTKEHLTGLLADALIGLYSVSAVLWYRKKVKNTPPLLQWSLTFSFYKIQKSFEGIAYNFGGPLKYFFKWIVFPFFRWNTLGHKPSSQLSQKVCQFVRQPEALNDLTQGIYGPDTPQAKVLEEGFGLASEAQALEDKIKQAAENHYLPKEETRFIYKTAFEKGIITEGEYKKLSRWLQLQWEATQVDSFTKEEYFS